MTREMAVLIIVAIAVLILLSMGFAWRARLRRDAKLIAPLGVPEHAVTTGRHEILYVATTKHDEPLERLAITPLTYRARGELVLTDRGVALSLDGSPTVFFARERMLKADRATVAIDRVVERDGLIRIVWRVAEGTIADSYFRLTSAEPSFIISELQPLCAASENGVNS